MARDPEMSAFAEEERQSALVAMAALEADLQRMLLPKDPNDERNVFLEIRAGTGGDESALFAGDLLPDVPALRRAAALAGRRWSRRRQSELGGYKEVIAAHRRRRRLLEAQVRVGRPSGAAGARDRGAGPHPHLRVHGRGDARGRPGRGDIRSIRPTCGSTPSARRARAASTSTRPTRRCASPTCRPGSSSSARTTARSTATARRRWRCWRRGCSTASGANGSRRRRRCARACRQRRPQRAHPHLQLPAGPRHRPPDQPDAVQDRRDHGRRHGRARRRAAQELQAEQLAALSGEEA